MTPDDAAKVLTLIAVYDNRSFEKVTAHAWADALDGLELADCLAAVKAHFRRSKNWLMPADLRELVRGILRERMQAEVQARYAAAERPAVIEAAPEDQAKADARAAEIRRLIADASRIPEPENPHPPADAKLEMRARTIACPWCHVPAGEACTNMALKRRSRTTHALRLEAVLQAAS